ncbi:hypothetical protein HanRHA438_Chr07g0302681 [Helianthus annuus]|nr:hypothetical protein HanRHA438_Chr07g0302681 [Helianthus annuus]
MILRTINRILRADLLCMGIYTHAVCCVSEFCHLHIREIESIESILSGTHTHTLREFMEHFCKH